MDRAGFRLPRAAPACTASAVLSAVRAAATAEYRALATARGGRRHEDTGEDERAGHHDPVPADRPEPRENRAEEHGRRSRAPGRPAQS